jgi:hypothetical protein
VLETNPTQLERLIIETEAAIFLRLQELAMSSDGDRERCDIEAATADLLTLKMVKTTLAGYTKILDQSCPSVQSDCRTLLKKGVRTPERRSL